MPHYQRSVLLHFLQLGRKETQSLLYPLKTRGIYVGKVVCNYLHFVLLGSKTGFSDVHC